MTGGPLCGSSSPLGFAFQRRGFCVLVHICHVIVSHGKRTGFSVALICLDLCIVSGLGFGLPSQAPGPFRSLGELWVQTLTD